jgi:hypothetical protein
MVVHPVNTWTTGSSILLLLLSLKREHHNHRPIDQEKVKI